MKYYLRNQIYTHNPIMYMGASIIDDYQKELKEIENALIFIEDLMNRELKFIENYQDEYDRYRFNDMIEIEDLRREILKSNEKYQKLKLEKEKKEARKRELLRFIREGYNPKDEENPKSKPEPYESINREWQISPSTIIVKHSFGHQQSQIPIKAIIPSKKEWDEGAYIFRPFDYRITVSNPAYVDIIGTNPNNFDFDRKTGVLNYSLKFKNLDAIPIGTQKNIIITHQIIATAMPQNNLPEEVLFSAELPITIITQEASKPQPNPNNGGNGSSSSSGNVTPPNTGSNNTPPPPPISKEDEGLSTNTILMIAAFFMGGIILLKK